MSRFNHFRNLFFSLILCFLICFTAKAQSAGSPTASIAGNITDQQNFSLGGVKITIKNLQTNISREVFTFEDGNFLLTQLPPGEYQVTLFLDGFAKTAFNVSIDHGTTAKFNLSLKPAVVQEEIIEITANNLLDDTRTERSISIGGELTNSLPIDPGNSVYVGNIACLLGDRALPKGVSSNFGFVFNSQQGSFNHTSTDGVDNNDTNNAPPRAFFSPSTAKDFQILSDNYSAEYGRLVGGCFINGITNRGSNEFHGLLFSQIRNDSLTGRNAFAKFKPESERYFIDSSLSGPIIKDKLFFFSSFSRLSSKDNSVVTIRDNTVSSINQLGFNLSNGPLPFSNGITTFLLRLDGQLQNNNFSARYNGNFIYNGVLQPFVAQISDTSALIQRSDNNGILLQNTYFNSNINLVNESRFLFEKTNQTLSPNNASPLVTLLPTEGFTQFGRGITGSQPREERYFQFVNNTTINKSKYLLRFGVDLLYNQTLDNSKVILPTAGHAIFLALDFSKMLNQPNLPFFTGLQTFDPSLRTPEQLAFLRSLSQQFPQLGVPRNLNLANLSLPSTYIQGFGDNTTGLNRTLFSLFLQNDIKLRPNFMLRAGVRYDLNRVDFGPNNNGNISPRLAFSYRPGKLSQLNIRGAFGLFFGVPIVGPYLTSKVFSQNFQLASLIFPLSTIPFSLANRRFPEGQQPPQNINFIPQLNQTYQLASELPNTYTIQSNFAIDYFLNNKTQISLDYNLTRGIKIGSVRNINPIIRVVAGNPIASATTGRPNPNQGLLFEYAPAFDSYYHAFTVVGSRKLSQGISFLAQYTFSKAIDNVVDISPIGIQEIVNPLNLQQERGLSLQDVRNRFTFSGVFGLETINQRLKNTQLSPVLILQSGQPYNLIATADLDMNGDFLPADRPQNVGRNKGIAPGFATLDLRLTQKINLTENLQLALFVDGFNIFNRVNISQIDRGFAPNQTGSFSLPKQESGRFIAPKETYRAAFSARQIQFGFKLNF